MNLLEPMKIHNYLHTDGVTGVKNLKTCDLVFRVAVCSHHTEFMALFVVFNLRICPGFIFEPCS